MQIYNFLRLAWFNWASCSLNHPLYLQLLNRGPVVVSVLRQQVPSFASSSLSNGSPLQMFGFLLSVFMPV